MAEPMTAWEHFSEEVGKRKADYAAMLPQDVAAERFMASAVAAVRERPELLQATPRSLFSAMAKAAQDGILPDGREGVILHFNTKVTVRHPDGRTTKEWENQASWLPMVPGIRRRARALEGIVVNAEVVRALDTYERHFGDNPSLIHKPPQLGEPRGEGIGVYAIFRKDGEILHREEMDAEQIENVRKQSRSPDGLLWKEFWTEAWRKTVIRRGFKSVPVGRDMSRILSRDDAMYDFGEAPERPAAPPEVGRKRRQPEPPEIVSGRAQETPPLTRQAKGPRRLPLNPDAGGERPDWKAWGSALNEAILAAESQAEIDEWLKLNEEPMNAARDTAAPIHDRLIEIAEIRRAQLERADAQAEEAQ